MEGCDKKVNFLVSSFIIKLKENFDFSNITSSNSYVHTNIQAKTGNKLCYGSHKGDKGVFQTHMR